MKRFFFLQFHLCSILVFSSPILMFGNSEKPPKYYLHEGIPRGILIEIMEYLDSQISTNFRLQLYPWARSYHRALNGEGGIFGLSMTQERLEIFDYSDVIFYDELLLIVRKGEGFEYEGVDDLEGLRVGARRGSSYGDDFERGKQDIFTLIEDNTGVERLRKLLAGRINVAIIGPGLPGFYRILLEDEFLALNQGQFEILNTPFSRDPNYIGFAKTMNQMELIEELNRAIQIGYESGVIPDIIAEYTQNGGN